ncbi:hypothetical protein BCU4_0219 [Bacillus phage BCU4]|uniref:Uncharacterized protein n=1 Tax=Bacillus phage BCU4 TaxID=1126951 RepID=J9PS07_9CAUD|nr:hypothetical protein QLX27_gp220 [Bacillus phage BCU4]AEW47725.1 hypothetical protein BCU4_0219 [Bacillus phage BCU4]
MHGTVACPFCNNEQYVEFKTNGRWERPKCADCDSIFYAQAIMSFASQPISQCKEVTPTYICPKE